VEEATVNVVLMLGTLSRDPETRALPSGDLLLSFDLTTRRGSEPADSAPVVWFEPPESAPELTAGDQVVVVGRVRRRFFRTAGTTQSRTEVVATKVVPTRQSKRSWATIEQALAAVPAAFAEATST
jgi:single-strand DNA-binding protein